jgi:hypothetical protein
MNGATTTENADRAPFKGKVLAVRVRERRELAVDGDIANRKSDMTAPLKNKKYCIATRDCGRHKGGYTVGTFQHRQRQGVELL